MVLDRNWSLNFTTSFITNVMEVTLKYSMSQLSRNLMEQKKISNY